FLFFLFVASRTTEIFTLSLHDALPICQSWRHLDVILDKSVHGTLCPQEESRSRITQGPARHIRYLIIHQCLHRRIPGTGCAWQEDRKSTRLNSSHVAISYAVFCLKKKK